MIKADKLYGEEINGFYYFNTRKTVHFTPCTKAKTDAEIRLCGNEL